MLEGTTTDIHDGKSQSLQGLFVSKQWILRQNALLSATV